MGFTASVHRVKAGPVVTTLQTTPPSHAYGTDATIPTILHGMKTATDVSAGTAAPSAPESGAVPVTVWRPTQRLVASTKSVYRRPAKPASTHRAPRGASAVPFKPVVRSD